MYVSLHLPYRQELRVGGSCILISMYEVLLCYAGMSAMLPLLQVKGDTFKTGVDNATFQAIPNCVLYCMWDTRNAQVV